MPLSNRYNLCTRTVHSQIDVLNRDFRAMNPDIADVPSAFKDSVSDARVEFFLLQKILTEIKQTVSLVPIQLNKHF